jgi:nucleoside-diphosphate-sugar epimerase
MSDATTTIRKKSYTIGLSTPVLVTGATGYVAGVLIKHLLEEGVTVHATIHDPSKKAHLQYLQDVADKLPGTIKFFRGDLLDADSFAKGMKGCLIVFHTASPATFVVEDAQRDLVDPAVKGTTSVLMQASKTPSVKKVVLTSSVVAIFSNAADKYKVPNGVFTEDNWNRTASLDYTPYNFSKTLAEQKAWVIAGSQTQWKLVVVNPGICMGRGLKYHESSESFGIFKQIVGGEMKYGALDVALPMVDVRNVAEAHIAAGYSDTASGRNIIVGHGTSVFSIAKALVPKYGAEYTSIPTSV